MAIRPARGSISRPTLIWIIVAAFLIASGVGVYFAVRTGSRSAPPAGPAINLDAPPPTPSEGLSQSISGRAQFADKDDPTRVAGETLYKRLDPLPRGRYALEEPELWLFMKDGRTLHMQAAKGNVKFFPGTKKPESGRFEGGVIARLYAPGVATAASRPDPAKIAPEMLAYTGSITFDQSVGEYSTEDPVNLSSADMEIQGDGMTIVFDEVRSRVAQIELGAVGYLHARGGKSSPKSPDSQATPAPADSTAESKPAPSAPSAAAPAKTPGTGPKVDLYSVNIAGPISLSVGAQSPQTISADRLLAWARLVDGKLPPDAIAELRSKSKEPAKTAPAPASSPSGVASTSPPPPTPQAAAPTQPPGMRDRLEKLRAKGPAGIEPLTPIHDDDALLTWGGRLLGVALETQPPELAGEHVAVRFVSESKEPVMLLDSRTGSTVLCDTLHYGATTASAQLMGKDNRPITLADSRGGHGELPNLTLNLQSGIGQARDGPGYLERRDPTKKVASGDLAKQHLSWSDQADFVFATGSSGIGLQSIREAAFTGKAKGVSEDAEVTGDYLKATFADSGTVHESVLEKVIVDGHAVGKSGNANDPRSLAADKIELTFKPSGKKGDSTPSLLVATGEKVIGEQTELVPDEKDKTLKVPRTSKLVCRSLEATLERDAKGGTVVREAFARGDASFERSDGVKAAGDEIHAMIADKTATVTGDKASVAARGASLAAPDLFLDGGREAPFTFADLFPTELPLHAGKNGGMFANRFYGVIARGPGRLEHTDPAAAKLEPGQLAALPPDQIGVTTLSWSKGLRYNDSSGEGEAVGTVVAVTHPDPFTQNTVSAERVSIRTAPAPPKANTHETAQSEPGGVNPLEGLRLLSAEAIAGEQIDKNVPKATAEQRIYVADEKAQGGRRLEKLTYIEGPRLVADEEHGVFRVPAAGRALVLDHSVAKQEKAPSAGSPFASAGTRGTTLLEWSGSMTLNRLTELADATGGVRITHKPLSPADKPIILNADSVQARFKLASKSAASGDAPPANTAKEKDQLVSATATGGVRIETDNGNTELTADQATYFAVDQIVEASATQQYSGVTWLDKTKGVPIIARKLRWNLRTDAVEIIEPMPTVAPLK